MSDELRREFVVAMSSEQLRGMAQRLNDHDSTRGGALWRAINKELTRRRARRIGLGPK